MSLTSVDVDIIPDVMSIAEMSLTSVDVDIIPDVMSILSFFGAVLERDDRDALPRLRRGGGGGGAIEESSIMDMF